jgi:hypothetical protein
MLKLRQYAIGNGIRPGQIDFGWLGGQMDIELLVANSGPDRFATGDEVRAALSLLPDFVMNNIKDSFWEVPSDCGGYQLIEINEEGEELTLYEKLNSLAN